MALGVIDRSREGNAVALALTACAALARRCRRPVMPTDLVTRDLERAASSGCVSNAEFAAVPCGSCDVAFLHHSRRRADIRFRLPLTLNGPRPAGGLELSRWPDSFGVHADRPSPASTAPAAIRRRQVLTRDTPSNLARASRCKPGFSTAPNYACAPVRLRPRAPARSWSGLLAASVLANFGRSNGSQGNENDAAGVGCSAPASNGAGR
jgi:hypothetical protein